ncbi:MAG: hypothetical protein JRF36_03430 [Deltaproteobacteria bacterium]|nr:hypothetical protein [Deltaproteobacteria bacterium]
MECQLSRRQMLRFLSVVLPTALFGYRLVDYFDEERVCVHVYGLSQKLPDPLLQRPEKAVQRPEDSTYFHVGLPELIVCRTEKSLLDIFAYFWPVTRPEIKRFQNASTVLLSLPLIEHVEHFAGLKTALNRSRETQKGSLAVILTLNDFTRNACRRLVNICREKGVAELVIFKDPSKPPYLCSYPSRQKGFKKKPPIGKGYPLSKFA